MKPETVDLIKSLTAAEPEERRGTFRWPHYSFFVRYPLHEKVPNGGQWQAAHEALTAAGEESTSLAVALLSRHAWTAGRLGLLELAQRHWNLLPEDARAGFLAGFSIELPHAGDISSSVVAFLVRNIDKTKLDALSACELAVNFTIAEIEDPIAGILKRTGLPDARIPRLNPFDDPRWKKHIEPLSDRLVDLVFEVALKRNNHRWIIAALDAGADPNTPIWSLERSYNHKYSPLAYAISHEGAGMVGLLLGAGASCEGTPYAEKNQPLFCALNMGKYDLADRLLAGGASFSGPAAAPIRDQDGKRNRLIVVAEHRRFHGHPREELEVIGKKVGALIPLAAIETKVAYCDASAQPRWKTFLEVLVSHLDDDVVRLMKYEAQGLDTTLSGEEICGMIYWDAWDCLAYLLGKHGAETRARVLFRLRRKYPDFGAQRRWFETVAQEGGINVIAEFDPSSWPSFELPDGSRIHADLGAIAPPDHTLGPCGETEVFCREVKAELRRRGGRVVVTRLSQRWKLAPNPFKTPQGGPGGLRKLPRYELLDLIPAVREIAGRFIWLGISLGGVSRALQRHHLAAAEDFREWLDSTAGNLIVQEATERIAAQDAANRRPPKPKLNDDDLHGYPREFWPYLIRFENGLIGMEEHTSQEEPSLAEEYRTWAVRNKPDASFVPDPRIVTWEGWKLVPEELKPYFVYDELFDQPSVRTKAANEYEKAMIHKAVRWWNEKWMLPRVLPLLESDGKTAL